MYVAELARSGCRAGNLALTRRGDPCRVTSNTRWCRPWRFTSFTIKPVLGADFLCRGYLPVPVTSFLSCGRPSFADHPRAFFSSGDYSTVLGRFLSQPSDFSLSVYFCYVPTVVYRYGLLWERIVYCFRVVSVSMWYLLLHVFI